MVSGWGTGRCGGGGEREGGKTLSLVGYERDASMVNPVLSIKKFRVAGFPCR